MVVIVYSAETKADRRCLIAAIPRIASINPTNISPHSPNVGIGAETAGSTTITLPAGTQVSGIPKMSGRAGHPQLITYSPNAGKVTVAEPDEISIGSN